jgi:hypothetical protein
LAAANAQANSDSVLVLTQGGVMGSKDTGAAPPLQSLSEFIAAFGGTIIPALMKQPTALLEWNALVRTVVTLNDRHSWATANAYLEMLLTERVNTGASFADYDPRMVDSATRIMSRGTLAMTSGASSVAAGHGTYKHQFMPTVCKDWNLRGCHRDPCYHPHACPWAHCTSSDKRHTASECPSKPNGWTFARDRDNNSVGTHATRGGHVGKRGGRGGAASVVASINNKQ